MPSRESKVNPSTPRPGGRGLLRVDPERHFFTPAFKAGLGAAERVNLQIITRRERALLNLIAEGYKQFIRRYEEITEHTNYEIPKKHEGNIYG